MNTIAERNLSLSRVELLEQIQNVVIFAVEKRNALLLTTIIIAQFTIFHTYDKYSCSYPQNMNPDDNL